MKSHDLARLLLTLPDQIVAVAAHGHVYSSEGDRYSHGPLMVGQSTLNYATESGIDNAYCHRRHAGIYISSKRCGDDYSSFGTIRLFETSAELIRRAG